MKRLSLQDKKKIKRLIRNGESLNKIKTTTGIPKTTIYYYMRQILGRKIVQVVINKSDNELIGEIIGLFAGDGNFFYDKKRWERRIRFTFNKKEKNLADYYGNSIKNLTKKSPRFYDGGSVIIMELKSKEFTNFIFEYLYWQDRKTKTIEIRNKEILKNKKFIMGFLRGLIDSDGYVRKGRREIYYGSISKNLFQDFVRCLNCLGFKFDTYKQKRKGYSDFFKVRISGFEVDRFIKLVKPRKSLYMGRQGVEP